jgi:Uri superfamily endonuclease
MKGSYILLLELNESQRISVGRLGILLFPKGFYAYVGSALNGLESRVARHLRQSRKRYWHIDYLLDRAIIFGVILIPGEERVECILARTLSQSLLCIRHFGSSDCRCPGASFLRGR